MSTQIVSTIQPAAGNSLALVVGFEDFKLSPAVLKLVQNTTTDEGAVKGKLFDTLAKSNFDQMRIVPLSIKTGRVYFPPGGDLGSEPLCRSNDGIKPSEDAQIPQSPKCETCDHGDKMWKNFKATGQKPDCQEKFRLLFINRETGLPYWMTVGGKSVRHVKDLKKAIYRDILAGRMKGELRNIFDYSFEIKPVSVQGRKGTYYELSFVNLEKIQNIGEFGPLYEAFVRQHADIEASDNEAAVDAELSDVGDSAPMQDV
jgi:hypothetical protein